MNSTKVHSPWTPEQVSALTNWQTQNTTHPFTCRYHNDVVLIPSIRGWSCPVMYCHYQQYWAWEYMLSGNTYNHDNNTNNYNTRNNYNTTKFRNLRRERPNFDNNDKEILDDNLD